MESFNENSPYLLYHCHNRLISYLVIYISVACLTPFCLGHAYAEQMEYALQLKFCVCIAVPECGQIKEALFCSSVKYSEIFLLWFQPPEKIKKYILQYNIFFDCYLRKVIKKISFCHIYQKSIAYAVFAHEILVAWTATPLFFNANNYSVHPWEHLWTVTVLHLPALYLVPAILSVTLL